MAPAPSRYSAVAIGLHWLIAIAILALLVMGFVMENMSGNPALKFRLFQLHKSLGITVLALSLLRLVWRLAHSAPPLPPASKVWEKALAHGVHGGFYLLMIGLPLIGWLGVSASPMKMPTRIFGLFTLPHLPFFTNDPDPAATTRLLFNIHGLMAYTLIGLLVLHVGGALKHHFMLRNDVMLRMTPRFTHPLLRFLRGKNNV